MEKWILAKGYDPRTAHFIGVFMIDETDNKNKNIENTWAWFNNKCMRESLNGYKADSYKKYFENRGIKI